MTKFCEWFKICPYLYDVFILERKIAGPWWTIASCLFYSVLPVGLMFSMYYVPSIAAKVGGPFITLLILIMFCEGMTVTYQKAVAEMNDELYLSSSKRRQIFDLKKKVYGKNFPWNKVTWLSHQFHVQVLRSEAQYAHLCAYCVYQGYGYDAWYTRKTEILRQNYEKLRQKNEVLRQEQEVITSQPSVSSSITESFSIEMEDVSNVESSLMPQVTHRSRHPSSSSTEPPSSSTFVISAEVYRSNSDESS